MEVNCSGVKLAERLGSGRFAEEFSVLKAYGVSLSRASYGNVSVREPFFRVPGAFKFGFQEHAFSHEFIQQGSGYFHVVDFVARRYGDLYRGAGKVGLQDRFVLNVNRGGLGASFEKSFGWRMKCLSRASSIETMTMRESLPFLPTRRFFATSSLSFPGIQRVCKRQARLCLFRVPTRSLI